MAEGKKPKTADKPAAKEARSAMVKPKPKTKRAAAKPATKAPSKRAAAKPRKIERKPNAATKPGNSGFDVAKLMDHPLVADLLTVGAMAAVAAIADHNVKARTGEADKGSSKAVKAAGKAVAAAVGKRLLSEVDHLRKATKTND